MFVELTAVGVRTSHCSKNSVLMKSEEESQLWSKSLETVS